MPDASTTCEAYFDLRLRCSHPVNFTFDDLRLRPAVLSGSASAAGATLRSMITPPDSFGGQ